MLLALVMAIMMAASLAGGGFIAIASEEIDWPTEISIFTGDVQRSPLAAADTEVGKKIAELTGVKLNIEYLVGQDIMTKANLMVAGGVYPDLIHAGDNVGIFIAGEALIPLDGLIEEYGPNIRDIYRPKEFELAALQNGVIYVIPTNRPTVENLYPGAGYYLGYDVLKDAGFPIVKDIKQYRDIIVNYIEKNPTYEGQPTIGFTLPTDGARASAMEYGGARFLSGFPNDGVTQVNQKTLEANIVMLQPSTKAFLEFCNEMWNRGYMDPETFMQKDDEYLAKIASGRVVGVYDQRWAIEPGLSALESSGKTDRNLVAFPVVMEGVTEEYYRGPYAMAAQGVSISTACKDPEGVMRFLNRMATDDIQKLNAWGIEGIDYYLDADGKFQRTEEQWLNAFNMEYRWVEGIGEFNNLMPRYEQTTDEVYGVFNDGNRVNPNLHPDYMDLRYKPYEKQILADYNAQTLVDWFNPSYPARYQPGWSVRQQMPQDSDEFIAVNKALETAREWNAKIIMAPTADVDALWEEYQAILLSIPGLTSYEEEATRIIRESAQYYQ
jgi:ABC-type glycerol-3-phosphate transport system substrate-binding protein